MKSLLQQKIANSDDFADGQRIGTLRGHHNAGQFIGIAGQELFMVDPEEGEIEKVDWMNSTDTYLAGGEFSFDGSYGITLDAAGILTVFHPHEEGGHTHWEVLHSIEVSEHDASEMPEKSQFSFSGFSLRKRCFCE